MIKFFRNQDIILTPFTLAKPQEMNSIFNDLIAVNDGDEVYALSTPTLACDDTTSGSCYETTVEGFLGVSQFDDGIALQIGIYVPSSSVFYPSGSPDYNASTNPQNLDGTYQRQVYNTVKKMYYNNYNNAYNMFGIDGYDNSLMTSSLTNDISVFSLTISQAGDKIRPNTVVISNQSGDIVADIIDDGNYNLILSGTYFINKYPLSSDSRDLTTPLNICGLGAYLSDPYNIEPCCNITPTPTPTPAPTSTPTPTPTPTATSTPTPTATATPTPTGAPTNTPTPTPTNTPTPTPTNTPTNTPTATPTPTPEPPTATPTPTPTATPTPTPGGPTATPTPTPTPTPTNTPTPTPEPPTPTPVPTNTPTPTVTPTPTPTPTPEPPTPTPTPTPAPGDFFYVEARIFGSCSSEPNCIEYPSCVPCWDGTGVQDLCPPGNIAVSVTVTTYNQGGAIMESVGDEQSTISCGVVPSQKVVTIRYNSAFLGVTSSNTAIQVVKTEPRLDNITGCCTTITSPGTPNTVDDIIAKINYAINNSLGSGTVGDPYRMDVFT